MDLNKIDWGDPKLMGLLQMGMGILAANDGRRSTGQAIGTGLLSGGQQMSALQAQKQRLDALKSEDGRRTQEFEWQKKRYLDDQAQQQSASAAIANAYTPPSSQPNMGFMEAQQPENAGQYKWQDTPGGFDINKLIPALAQGGNAPLAMKVWQGRRPQNANEFGLVSQIGINPNTGKPEKYVQGKNGETKWLNIKPTIDELKVAELVDKGVIPPGHPLYPQASNLPTNNFNTGYPVTFGAPGTTKTDVAEGTTGDIPLRPISGSGKSNLPPASQRKINEKQAESVIDIDTAGKKRTAEVAAESAAKKEATMSGLGDIISEARSVLTGKVKPTSSGIGSVVDAAGMAFGYSPEGAAEADKLKAIGGALVAKMPRMEGPQSNYDVENYKLMAGDVGNPRLPIERRIAALDAVEKLWAKYDKQSSNKPDDSFADLPKASQYKGQTIRDTETGQRFKSNGMSWVEVK